MSEYTKIRDLLTTARNPEVDKGDTIVLLNRVNELLDVIKDRERDTNRKQEDALVEVEDLRDELEDARAEINQRADLHREAVGRLMEGQTPERVLAWVLAEMDGEMVPEQVRLIGALT